MKRNDITIDGRYFASPVAARNHMRRMRNRWAGKGPITGPDHKFLLALFDHHPSALRKAPAAISHFEVRLGPQVGQFPRQWCFFVIDMSGNASAFSAKKALKEAFANVQVVSV